MVKKWSCSAVLLPVAMVLHGALTAVEVVMLRAGTGSVNRQHHSQNGEYWYVARIETENYVANVKQIDPDGDPHGLPDSHDFSRRKDFYTIYPSLYCSGKKDGNNYQPDYCSPWGRQFDLQWLWREWGIDLMKNNYIGYRPRVIFYSLCTSTTGTSLSLLLGVIGIFSWWGKVASCALSWLSFIALIAYTVTCQQLVSALVSNAHHVQPTNGSGNISATSGSITPRVAWVMAFLSLADAILMTYIVWGTHRRRVDKRNQQQAGHGGGGFFGVGSKLGGVYQYLAPGGKGGVHGSSQVELMGKRDASPAPGRMAVAVGITAQASAYEPMRHRGV